MKEGIIDKALALENSLKKSNNNSSKLFMEIRRKVESSKSDSDLKEILEPLKSIGSISQYGDFNNNQDILLEELLKEINAVLNIE